MDHPCDKCGQSVEDGVPFCAHCGAPQIRVSLPEPSPATADSSSNLSHPELSFRLKNSDTADFSIRSATIQWQQGMTAAAMAGAVTGLGMTLMGSFGVWGAIAGFMAVVFYRRRTLGTILNPRAGAQLGAISGIVGFGLFAVIAVPTGLFRDMMREMMKQLASRLPQSQLQDLAEMIKTQQGLAFLLLFLFFLVILASALGGALGGAFLGRKRRS
jgi:hypothetical protein